MQKVGGRYGNSRKRCFKTPGLFKPNQVHRVGEMRRVSLQHGINCQACRMSADDAYIGVRCSKNVTTGVFQLVIPDAFRIGDGIAKRVFGGVLRVDVAHRMRIWIQPRPAPSNHPSYSASIHFQPQQWLFVQSGHAGKQAEHFSIGSGINDEIVVPQFCRQGVQSRWGFLTSKVQLGRINDDIGHDHRKPLSKGIDLMLTNIQPVEVVPTDILWEKNIFVNQEKTGYSHTSKRDLYFASSRSNAYDGSRSFRQALEIQRNAGGRCHSCYRERGQMVEIIPPSVPQYYKVKRIARVAQQK